MIYLLDEAIMPDAFMVYDALPRDIEFFADHIFAAKKDGRLRSYISDPVLADFLSEVCGFSIAATPQTIREAVDSLDVGDTLWIARKRTTKEVAGQRKRLLFSDLEFIEVECRQQVPF